MKMTKLFQRKNCQTEIKKKKKTRKDIPNT